MKIISKLGNTIWSGLTWLETGSPSLSRMTFGNTDSGPLTFVVRSSGYNDVLVFRMRREAVQKVANYLRELYPRFLHKRRMEALNYVRLQQEINRKTLIEHGEEVDRHYGYITCEGGQTLRARNCRGDIVPEALMLYYDAEEPVTVVEADYTNKTPRTFQTRTVCHIDLAPSITCSTSKNIVQTQVQGRDYSRKELVSGGDLEFKVDGSIMGFEADVYPTSAVRKFIQVMQYNGILKVNNLIFDQYNVKQVIIKDFSLGKPTYKNIQPYSLSCVAVEPDEDVRVTEDTIMMINNNIKVAATESEWYDAILKNKFAKQAAKLLYNEAVNMVVGTTAEALGSLDELTKKLI